MRAPVQLHKLTQICIFFKLDHVYSAVVIFFAVLQLLEYKSHKTHTLLDRKLYPMFKTISCQSINQKISFQK